MTLHYKLFSLGNIIPLNIYVDSIELQKDISPYKERFKPYNPRKKGYNRSALSITSHDGGFSGKPNLDSLFEYNQIHNTHYKESDFREPTSFFKSSQTLQKALKPFEGAIGRSHILKLDKGGFVPPHRDWGNCSFRLFFSITSSVHYVFILDGQKISLKLEQFYCLNTNLSHSLFSFKDNSLFAVFNIDLNESSLQSVYKNLESF